MVLPPAIDVLAVAAGHPARQALASQLRGRGVPHLAIGRPAAGADKLRAFL